MNVEMTDVKIEERRSAMKGEMKDATTDVTRREGSEADLEKGKEVDIKMEITLVIGPQIAEIDITRGQRIAVAVSNNKNGLKVKIGLKNNSKLRQQQLWIDKIPIMDKSMARATKSRFQPLYSLTKVSKAGPT